MHLVHVPTLFLNAEDDPCINPTLYAFKEFEVASDYVILAMTKRGGHCGYFTGGLMPKQWHPTLFLEFYQFLESK